MTNPFKTFATWILSKELTALKNQLTSASTSLDDIAKRAVEIPVDASEEVKTLAQSVLALVLSSLDKDRSKFTGFTHAFEKQLYVAYQGSLTKLDLVATKAKALEHETAEFLSKIKL